MLKKVNKTNISEIIIYITYFFLLFNFILYNIHGGGDDYHLLHTYKNLNILHLIDVTLKSITSTRLIGELSYGILYYLTGWNKILLNLIPVFSWFFTIIILRNCLKNFISKKSLVFFQTLALFPFICTSIFASPIYAGQYFFSILFWSLSLYFILRYSTNCKKVFFILHLIFITLAIWTIESFPALLILTISLPIINMILKKKDINYLNLILVYILPVCTLFFLFLLHKFFFSLFYVDEVYQFNPNLLSFYQGLYYFFSITVEVFFLFLTSINFLNFKNFIIFLLIFSIFFLILEKNNQKKDSKQKIYLYLIIIIFSSLILSSVIFFLSGFPASSFGYFNKLMVPSFLSLTIFLSLIFEKFYLKIKYFFWLIPVFFILSFQIQIKNIVDASNLRIGILKKIEQNIILKKLNNFNLITILPIFLDNNYNNERVFFTTSTVRYFLKDKNILLKDYWMINERMRYDLNYMDKINIYNHLNEIKSDEKYYIFYYDQNLKEENFFEISNKKDLLEFIHKLEFKNYEQRFIINQRLRYYFKNLYN